MARNTGASACSDPLWPLASECRQGEAQALEFCAQQVGRCVGLMSSLKESPRAGSQPCERTRLRALPPGPV